MTKLPEKPYSNEQITAFARDFLDFVGDEFPKDKNGQLTEEGKASATIFQADFIDTFSHLPPWMQIIIRETYPIHITGSRRAINQSANARNKDGTFQNALGLYQNRNNHREPIIYYDNDAICRSSEKPLYARILRHEWGHHIDNVIGSGSQEFSHTNNAWKAATQAEKNAPPPHTQSNTLYPGYLPLSTHLQSESYHNETAYSKEAFAEAVCHYATLYQQPKDEKTTIYQLFGWAAHSLREPFFQDVLPLCEEKASELLFERDQLQEQCKQLQTKAKNLQKKIFKDEPDSTFKAIKSYIARAKHSLFSGKNNTPTDTSDIISTYANLGLLQEHKNNLVEWVKTLQNPEDEFVQSVHALTKKLNDLNDKPIDNQTLETYIRNDLKDRPKAPKILVKKAQTAKRHLTELNWLQTKIDHIGILCGFSSPIDPRITLLAFGGLTKRPDIDVIENHCDAFDNTTISTYRYARENELKKQTPPPEEETRDIILKEVVDHIVDPQKGIDAFHKKIYQLREKSAASQNQCKTKPDTPEVIITEAEIKAPTKPKDPPSTSRAG